MNKSRVVLPALAALLVLPATASSQQQEDRPIVMPPHSVVDGKSIGEWSALWWKWALAIPVNDNPSLDKTGAKAKFGDVGSAFFLANWLGPPPGPVSRSVMIPENKFIFVPIEVAADDNSGNGCIAPSTTPCAGRLTVDQLVTQLDAFFNVTALHASIDSEPVNDLFEHRERAPIFGYTEQLTDNVIEVVFGYAGPDSAGTVFPVVADGYYLMLRPLPVGQHTISFGGTLSGVGDLDITYHVTVTPEASNRPALLIP